MYKHDCYLVCPDSTIYDHDNYICLDISSKESKNVPIFFLVGTFLILIMVLVKQVLARSITGLFIKKKLNTLSLYEKNQNEYTNPKNTNNNNNFSSPIKTNSEAKITTVIDDTQ